MDREGRIALSAASDLNTPFKTLLEGNPISPEKTQNYMKQLGWHLGSYSYILVLRPETGAGETPIPGAVMDELTRAPGFRGVIHRERLVLFFSSEKRVSDWSADVPAPVVMLCKDVLHSSAYRSVASHGVPRLRMVYSTIPGAIDMHFNADFHPEFPAGMEENIVRPELSRLFDDLTAGLTIPLTELEAQTPPTDRSASPPRCL